MTTVIAAHPGYWLHELYYGYDDDLNRLIEPEHVHHPIVAWWVDDDDGCDDRAYPVLPATTDMALSSTPESYHHYAIERPDGSFGAHTGYTYVDFVAWKAAVALSHREKLEHQAAKAAKAAKDA